MVSKSIPLQSSYLLLYLYKFENIQIKAELIYGDRSQDSGFFGEVAWYLGG